MNCQLIANATEGIQSRLCYQIPLYVLYAMPVPSHNRDQKAVTAVSENCLRWQVNTSIQISLVQLYFIWLTQIILQSAGKMTGKSPRKGAGKHPRKQPSGSGKGIATPAPKRSFKRSEFKYLPPRRVVIADPPSGNANLVSSNAAHKRRINPNSKFLPLNLSRP
jgi:hypothetical protein